MKVSVLICVRDGERFLGEAVESALAQTAPPHEIVVVDDGSTDGSAAVAAGYDGVRVVRQPPLGLGAARNRAVREATGDLVAFLDCDNRWDPRKLEMQVRAFVDDPELDFAFTHAREFATPGEEDAVTLKPGVLPGGLTSSLCARREAIAKAGGFDEEVKVGQLLSWLTRARELGLKETTIPEVLLHRRVHAENMGVKQRAEVGDYARILKASLDRRRRAG